MGCKGGAEIAVQIRAERSSPRVGIENTTGPFYKIRVVFETRDFEGVGGEVMGGQLAGEWVPLIVAP